MVGTHFFVAHCVDESGLPMSKRLADFLREQAEKCRRLARAMTDPITCERLRALAAEYDAKATKEDESRDTGQHDVH